MKHKYVFTAGLLLLITLCCVIFTSAYVKGHGEEAGGEVTVVTSFYPMYIAVENIIGDNENITLQNLSEPQTGCLHDYQLTPEDMKMLSAADIFIINGGGIESFLSDVAKQYKELTIINSSSDIKLLEDNAHAWMSLVDYSTQIQTILNGLISAYPADADAFTANARVYQEKITDLKIQQQEIIDVAAGTSVITFHEAYDYVAADLGFDICYSLDLDEERQVSAGEVADLLSAVKDNGISIILAEELYGGEMGDMVKKEVGTEVYYLNTLVRGDYNSDSYIEGMQENIYILKKAFGVE